MRYSSLQLIVFIIGMSGIVMGAGGPETLEQKQGPVDSIQETLTGMATYLNPSLSNNQIEVQNTRKQDQGDPQVTIEGGENKVEVKTTMWVPQGGYTTSINSNVNTQQRNINADIRPRKPSGYSTDVVKEINVLETIEIETPGNYQVTVNVADGGVSGRGRSSPQTVTQTVEVKGSDEPPEEGSPEFSISGVDSDDKVEPGDTLGVDVTVLNGGDGEGSDSLTMNVFDQSVSSEVSLGSGESTTETIQADVPNDYKLYEYKGTVGIGDASKEFNGFVNQGSDGPPPLPNQNNPPEDPDGDGLYEDINGNGVLEPVDDVDVLVNNLDSDAVQDNPENFDFTGDGNVYIGDTSPLFTELQEMTGGDIELNHPEVEGPVKDLNGDGLFRDVSGDGQLSSLDPAILFDNLDNQKVVDNPEMFNFDGDEPAEVTVFDTNKLFQNVGGSAEISVDFPSSVSPGEGFEVAVNVQGVGEYSDLRKEKLYLVNGQGEKLDSGSYDLSNGESDLSLQASLEEDAELKVLNEGHFLTDDDGQVASGSVDVGPNLDIQISDRTDGPINLGKTFTVQVLTSTTEGQVNDQNIELEVEGVVKDSEQVSLNSGEQYTATLNWEPQEVGTYSFTVSGNDETITGEITVETGSPGSAGLKIIELIDTPQTVSVVGSPDVNVKVEPVQGETGSGTVRLLRNGEEVTSDIIAVNGDAWRISYLTWQAPSSPGEYTYTVETGSSTETFTLNVEQNPSYIKDFNIIPSNPEPGDNVTLEAEPFTTEETDPSFIEWYDVTGDNNLLEGSGFTTVINGITSSKEIKLVIEENPGENRYVTKEIPVENTNDEDDGTDDGGDGSSMYEHYLVVETPSEGVPESEYEINLPSDEITGFNGSINGFETSWDGGDNIDEDTIEGTVSGGNDAVKFNGSTEDVVIEKLENQIELDVYIDGTELEKGRYPKTDFNAEFYEVPSNVELGGSGYEFDVHIMSEGDKPQEISLCLDEYKIADTNVNYDGITGNFFSSMTGSFSLSNAFGNLQNFLNGALGQPDPGTEEEDADGEEGRVILADNEAEKDEVITWNTVNAEDAGIEHGDAPTPELKKGSDCSDGEILDEIPQGTLSVTDPDQNSIQLEEIQANNYFTNQPNVLLDIEFDGGGSENQNLRLKVDGSQVDSVEVPPEQSGLSTYLPLDDLDSPYNDIGSNFDVVADLENGGSMQASPLHEGVLKASLEAEDQVLDGDTATFSLEVVDPKYESQRVNAEIAVKNDDETVDEKPITIGAYDISEQFDKREIRMELSDIETGTHSINANTVYGNAQAKLIEPEDKGITNAELVHPARYDGEKPRNEYLAYNCDSELQEEYCYEEIKFNVEAHRGQQNIGYEVNIEALYQKEDLILDGALEAGEDQIVESLNEESNWDGYSTLTLEGDNGYQEEWQIVVN